MIELINRLKFVIPVQREIDLTTKDVSGWSRWLGGLLIFLLLLALFWFGLRWLDIRAEDWVLGENKPLQHRFQALSEQQDSIRGSWLRTLNPAMKNIQGGLVWSSSEQQGVMQLLNLPDPPRGFQYHLWIYDARGGSGVPVSASILTAGSGKYEQFVVIEPTAQVVEPFKFELMLEPVR